MPYYPYTLAMLGYGKAGRQLDWEWSGGIGFPSERQPPTRPPAAKTVRNRIPPKNHKALRRSGHRHR